MKINLDNVMFLLKVNVVYAVFMAAFVYVLINFVTHDLDVDKAMLLAGPIITAYVYLVVGFAMIYMAGMFVSTFVVINGNFIPFLNLKSIYIMNTTLWQSFCVITILAMFVIYRYLSILNLNVMPLHIMCMCIVIIPFLNFVVIWLSGILQLDPSKNLCFVDTDYD